MGYMGHMSLIAEEIVKLFSHYPEEICQVVRGTMDVDAWEQYVSTVLRTTRQNDMALLGGGVSANANDTISSSSGMSDDDDEFPMSNRASRIMSLSTGEGSDQDPRSLSSGQQANAGNGLVHDQVGSGAKIGGILLTEYLVRTLPVAANIKRSS